MSQIVLALTGASGAIYGVRLLEVLLAAGSSVHLLISPAAKRVFYEELGLTLDLEHFSLEQVLPADMDGDSRIARLRPPVSPHGSSIFSDSTVHPGTVMYHHYQDWGAAVASGSFKTAGMVICPCSMGTLSSLANGLSSNLIHRAADVHLKERRKLIVVPRETPLGTIQLENMRKLSEAGAVILPAMPGFYHTPVTIHDLIDFVVGRICDQLGLEVDLTKRWGSN
ncbi:MAG: UbiX family flavin prenyltransferase [Planctomycetaceae bacterium]|nr:UbiX family flavin prenyltransferase [Planctomycetaceae bacterium]